MADTPITSNPEVACTTAPTGMYVYVQGQWVSISPLCYQNSGGGTGIQPDWNAPPGSPEEILNKPDIHLVHGPQPNEPVPTATGDHWIVEGTTPFKAQVVEAPQQRAVVPPAPKLQKPVFKAVPRLTGPPPLPKAAGLRKPERVVPSRVKGAKPPQPWKPSHLTKRPPKIFTLARGKKNARTGR